MDASMFLPPDGTNIRSSAGAPLVPPVEWFNEWPEWADPTAMTPEQPASITVVLRGPETGRVAGVFAQPGQCYLNDPDGCWTAQPDPTGYSLFHRPFHAVDRSGGVVTVQAGVLGAVNGGHTPGQPSMEHEMSVIANPDLHLAMVRAWDYEVDGRVFQVVTGALVPEATIGGALYLNRSALSGVWRCRTRWTDDDTTGGCRSLGPQLVTRPALPHRQLAGFALTMEDPMDTEPSVDVDVADLRSAVLVLHHELRALADSRVTAAACCEACAAKKQPAAGCSGGCRSVQAAETTGDIVMTDTADTADTADTSGLADRVDALAELVDTLAERLALIESTVVDQIPVADIPAGV